ncbi:ATP-binding protein [Sporolactobacillus sp. THM7-4]|nr:ATP-binding protein [Sporolactobacillus sp. THM7-4]
MKTKSFVEINSEWSIIQARRLGRSLSKYVGFNQLEQARITTVITELARNILLYARQGIIWMEIITAGGKTGLKITARDQGPGIKDIRDAILDGYTTSDSPGAGLPGVRELMDEFDINTMEGEGTTVTTIKWIDGTRL